MTGMLNNRVVTVMENKATSNNTLLVSPITARGFTEIFNKNPKSIPATVVNNELSLKIES
jgi:hypothetical protein